MAGGAALIASLANTYGDQHRRWTRIAPRYRDEDDEDDVDRARKLAAQIDGLFQDMQNSVKQWTTRKHLPPEERGPMQRQMTALRQKLRKALKATSSYHTDEELIGIDASSLCAELYCASPADAERIATIASLPPTTSFTSEQLAEAFLQLAEHNDAVEKELAAAESKQYCASPADAKRIATIAGLPPTTSFTSEQLAEALFKLAERNDAAEKQLTAVKSKQIAPCLDITEDFTRLQQSEIDLQERITVLETTESETETRLRSERDAWKSNYNKLQSRADQTQANLEGKIEGLKKSNKQLKTTESAYNALVTSEEELRTNHNTLVDTERELRESHNALISSESMLRENYNGLVHTESKLRGRYNALSTTENQIQQQCSALSSSESALRDDHNALVSTEHTLRLKYNGLVKTEQNLRIKYDALVISQLKLQEPEQAKQTAKDLASKEEGDKNALNAKLENANKKVEEARRNAAASVEQERAQSKRKLDEANGQLDKAWKAVQTLISKTQRTSTSNAKLLEAANEKARRNSNALQSTLITLSASIGEGLRPFDKTAAIKRALFDIKPKDSGPSCRTFPEWVEGYEVSFGDAVPTVPGGDPAATARLYAVVGQNALPPVEAIGSTTSIHTATMLASVIEITLYELKRRPPVGCILEMHEMHVADASERNARTQAITVLRCLFLMVSMRLDYSIDSVAAYWSDFVPLSGTYSTIVSGLLSYIEEVCEGTRLQQLDMLSLLAAPILTTRDGVSISREGNTVVVVDGTHMKIFQPGQAGIALVNVMDPAVVTDRSGKRDTLKPLTQFYKDEWMDFSVGLSWAN
ncbi:unnamed protein product [Zymoseptoria tritici ST99CH_1A5]|uniref:Uncharacterized protein n=1 Tax=Zymoseptoria tritici ST99CH_1A5 TaxID=1276529 RepID=A0A1Y6LHN1_ZYMTR|nr:unnamed protein product [Zymoseptoria tritici ST99CH_1A5]